MISRLAFLLLLAVCLADSVPAVALPGAESRANILLIVADDLGYADLGTFGSRIRTPNIDQLGREGIRFSQFRVSPACAPTRAMLLSGNNNHVAGMANQARVPAMLQTVAGYEQHLSDRIAPLPAVLRDAGYHTYMVGKWHLGIEPDHGPRAAGFERSFTLLNGAASHFDGRGYGDGPSEYRLDGKPVKWPEGRFSTDLYTDRLIEFIEGGRDDDKPFFAYAAYTSPHWPLQVPEHDLERYTGDYDSGYDALREENFRNLQEAGMLPISATLPPRNPEISPWSELTPAERMNESREMEIYSAMVENLDRHVGRLLDYLKRTGQYDNTLVLFMSDNGAAGEDPYNAGPFVAALRAQYENAYDKMGHQDSFIAYGPAWAEAGSAPFRLYKGYTTEGGIAAPLIIAGPGVVARNMISHVYLTVMDIAPTLIEIADATYPADGSVSPMLGKNFRSHLTGEAGAVHAEDDVTVLFYRGQAFVRQGRWKITVAAEPFDEQKFQLYDVLADPGETRDLSAALPDKYAELIRLWQTHRQELGIVLPEDL